MLWRALHDVENGFYIDVGANDPSHDSVTRAFYERGWHGINIEPLVAHFVDLQRERPRDINLRCAAGSSTGEIEIWECDIRGWASVDKAAIEGHEAAGNVGEYHQVPMRTLAEICEQNAPQEIHFLKIDVEGFEREVLEGMDFTRFRPWMLVVEATRPNSTEEVHSRWENILDAQDYIFVYADGINRYYLARERNELAEAFRYPPNVLDGFIQAGYFEANLKLQASNLQVQAMTRQFECDVARAEEKAALAVATAHRAEFETRQAEIHVQEAELLAGQAEVRAQEAEQKMQMSIAALNALHGSSSWRVTAPLRMIALAVKSGLNFPRAVKLNVTNRIKLLLAHSSLFINRRPRLKSFVFVFLKRFPGLEHRLKRVVSGKNAVQVLQPVRVTEFANLTASGRLIYDELKAGVEKNSKETHSCGS